VSETLPFLTADWPGLGGVIKMRDDDFLVEELPLYEASGSGSHTYALIEKRGIGTREALDRIARALNVPRRNIGTAGLKDAHAVTRQWISIEHAPPDRLEQLSVGDIRVLRLARHTNKLKRGHLAGNRFVIRLRQLKLPLPESARVAEQVLSVLAQKGVPNYFGPQRFGNRQNNHLLGRMLIANDAEAFIDLFLGRPQEGMDAPLTYRARCLFAKGCYQEAVGVWPRQFHEHRRALKALVRSGGDKRRAYFAVDKHLKGLLISAYQSDVFNRVLAVRMPHADRLLLGDMAYKHVNGACFRVESVDVEQPRCDCFEISPTGPLLGQRTTRLTGPAGDIENPLLNAEKLGENDFLQMKRLGARGGRRPLRFQPRHIGVATGQDELGPYLELRFELDAGCYATSLIAEITKERTSPLPDKEIPRAVE
jgi:tRNA pseudouridine13 synthase